MSPLMLTGEGDFEVISSKNVEVWPGLGLFPGAILDQHFVARQRQNRLLSVVLERPQYLGVGVDEATAVWLKPDGTFEVLGDGSVVVYDAAGATITRAPGDGSVLLGVRDLATHVLLRGDVFDLATRRVGPAALRAAVPPAAPGEGPRPPAPVPPRTPGPSPER
jgi:cyanophycinase